MYILYFTYIFNYQWHFGYFYSLAIYEESYEYGCTNMCLRSCFSFSFFLISIQKWNLSNTKFTYLILKEKRD